MRSDESLSARFGSELSRVLFVDPMGSRAVRPSSMERAVVGEICALIERFRTDERQMQRICDLLESKALPVMTAESQMLIGAELERYAPSLIRKVKQLAGRKAHLVRAADLSESYSAERLRSYKAAIEAEIKKS